MGLLRSPGLRLGGAVPGGGSALPDALTPNAGNPLISTGTYGFGSVVEDGGTYYAFMHMTNGRIDLYTASDPVGPWTSVGTVLSPSEAWEDGEVGVPYAWKEGSTWYMIYRGDPGPTSNEVGLATASDPAGPWTKDASNPIIADSDTIGGGAEASGPIKVGSTYYLLVESNTGVARVTEIFTSTDLTTWTAQADGPILDSGRFCGFLFSYSGLYWLITPHYTGGVADEAEFELYRSPRPTFREYERVELTPIYSAADISSPEWDHKDIDTPVVLTPDVTRTLGGELRVYYAGSANGTFSDGGLGLLESGDPAGVLGVLAGLAFMHISATDWNAGTLIDTDVLGHALVLATTDGTTAISQTSNATTGAGLGADDTDEIGNTFTPGSDINGFALEAYLEVTSAPTHGLRCNIYAQDMFGETPQGSPAPIATAETTHTTTGWARFEFPTTILTGSQTYTYLIETTGSEGTDRYNVKSDGTDPYAGGSYTYWSPVSGGYNEYRRNTSFDCAFKVIELDAVGSGTFTSPELDISSVGTASGPTKIRWDATEPSGANVAVETRISTDGGSTWTAWASVTNGGSIPSITAGLNLASGRVQYRATLTATGATPALEQVLLEVEAQ